MEPTKAEIAFSSTVVAIKEHKKEVWLGGVGPEARFQEVSQGWFVGLEGSHEYIKVSNTEPNIAIGDQANVRITFHAKPSQS